MGASLSSVVDDKEMSASVEKSNMVKLSVVDTDLVRTPELDAMAKEIIDQIRFASGKAMANIADPRVYPLPDDKNTIERILVDAAHEMGDAERFELLKSQGRKFAASPLTKIDRRRSELFQAVDLRSDIAVFEQIATKRKFVRPLSEGQHVLSGNVPSPAEEPKSTLTWHLNKVLCNEETGPTNADSDHLYVGGTMIDPFGNAVSGGVHDLGDGWDTGNELPFDTNVAVSNLSYGVGWPRTYYYISAISVRGNDKLYAFLDKLVQVARDYAINAAATAAGGAAGAWIGLKIGASVGSLGGFLGAAAGAAVGALVGYLVGSVIAEIWNEIKGYFKNETKLFGSITMKVRLPNQGALAPDGSNTLPNMNLVWPGFNGKYTLTFDVQLNWIPSFRPAAIARMADHLELVATDTSHGFKLRSWSSATGHKWTDWEQIANFGVSNDSPVTLVAPNPLRLTALTIDTSGYVQSVERQWSLTEASGWKREPLPSLSPTGLICGSVVSAASRGQNHVDVFATAMDGHVYTAAKGPQTDNTWAGWWKVGDGQFLAGTPVAAISRSEGRLDLFAVGLDGRIWSAAYGPDAAGNWDWVGWFPILSEVFVPGTHVTATSRQTDQIDLFAVNLNGEVRTAAWSANANAGKWAGWWRVTETNGQFMPGTPVSAVHRSEGQIDLFAVGFDGRIWTAAWGPQTAEKWAGWWSIGDARFAQGSVIAATTCGVNRLDVFMRGFDGNVWSHAWDGEEWKTLII